MTKGDIQTLRALIKKHVEAEIELREMGMYPPETWPETEGYAAKVKLRLNNYIKQLSIKYKDQP